MTRFVDSNMSICFFTVCSELLFEKTFEVQERKRETLRQLHLEALLRERGALSLAYVEFNLQTRISEENIEEYQSQVRRSSQ